MKTDKFDETIRKKLSEIQPEFTDQDWNSFRKYYKANTPGSFWKSYGAWFGYGSAASLFIALSAVCGLLYHQNEVLKDELRDLKHIVAQKGKAGAAEENVVRETAPDVYPDNRNEEDGPKSGQSEEIKQDLIRETATGRPFRGVKSPVPGRNAYIPGESPESKVSAAGEIPLSSGGQGVPQAEEVAAAANQPSPAGAEYTERGLWQSQGLTEIYREAKMAGSRKMTLPAISISRLKPEASPKVTAAAKPVAKPEEIKKPQEQKKALPDFITSRPYRLGFSVSRTKDMLALGIENEFLIARSVSVTWGLSRTVYDPLEYFNERAFADRTKQNFRKTFGKTIPFNGEVMNIKTNSSLMQIPLAVSYRQPLPAGFVVTGGVGTMLNVRFRQNLGYDFWDGHKLIELSGLKYRKQSYPLVNNFSPSLGVEKIFDPIVFRGEVFYHLQKKDIPYMNSSDGFGARFKLLYQFGK